jgi:hypothetical protein
VERFVESTAASQGQQRHQVQDECHKNEPYTVQIGLSAGLLSRASQVRILPGAPLEGPYLLGCSLLVVFIKIMYFGSGTHRVHISSAMCSEAPSSRPSREVSFEYLPWRAKVLAWLPRRVRRRAGRRCRVRRRLRGRAARVGPPAGRPDPRPAADKSRHLRAVDAGKRGGTRWTCAA